MVRSQKIQLRQYVMILKNIMINHSLSFYTWEFYSKNAGSFYFFAVSIV